MVSKSLIFLSYILGTRSVAGHTRRTGLAIARLIRILMSSPGGPNQDVRFFLGLGTRAVRPTPERPGASLGYNDEISRVCLCAANSGYIYSAEVAHKEFHYPSLQVLSSPNFCNILSVSFMLFPLYIG